MVEAENLTQGIILGLYDEKKLDALRRIFIDFGFKNEPAGTYKYRITGASSAKKNSTIYTTDIAKIINALNKNLVANNFLPILIKPITSDFDTKDDSQNFNINEYMIASFNRRKKPVGVSLNVSEQLFNVVKKEAKRPSPIDPSEVSLPGSPTNAQTQIGTVITNKSIANTLKGFLTKDGRINVDKIRKFQITAPEVITNILDRAKTEAVKQIVSGETDDLSDLEAIKQLELEVNTTATQNAFGTRAEPSKIKKRKTVKPLKRNRVKE